MYNFTEQQLVSAIPSFNNLFQNPQAIAQEFNTPFNPEHLILYADYCYEDYSGSAYVLGYNVRTETFFEVHGSHCSCYGLEEQWSEEDCTVEELNELFNRRYAPAAYRSDYNKDCSDDFKNWLDNIQ